MIVTIPFLRPPIEVTSCDAALRVVTRRYVEYHGLTTPMKSDTFLKKIADDNAVKPGTHEPAPPLRAAEHGRWKARHPGLKLPNDLVGFLKRANGIRFHLSAEFPFGAAARLLPVREIQTATALLYQDQEEE